MFNSIIKKIVERLNAEEIKIKILCAYCQGNMKNYEKEAKYVIKHKACFLPYNFVNEYKKAKVQIFFDKTNGMHYVNHRGKKLYFPVEMNEKKIVSMYKGLLAEQDIRSPHHYWDENDNFMKSTFVDCGAAEGLISLDIVEECRKIYLVECDGKWKEALCATFEPWNNKIDIINKFVGDKDNEDTIMLDTLIKEEGNIVIKMDIEGAEMAALAGANKILKENNVKLAICTYHNISDYDDIDNLLRESGYSVKATDGGVLWISGTKGKHPYFRKCLIKANR